DAEERWINARRDNLRFVEVRGLPPIGNDAERKRRRAQLLAAVTDPETGQSIDLLHGTLRRIVKPDKETGRPVEHDVDSSFVCGHCGLGHDFREAVAETKHTPPTFPYVLQIHCPICKAEKQAYNGRSFKAPDQEDLERWLLSVRAWEA